MSCAEIKVHPSQNLILNLNLKVCQYWINLLIKKMFQVLNFWEEKNAENCTLTVKRDFVQ